MTQFSMMHTLTFVLPVPGGPCTKVKSLTIAKSTACRCEALKLYGIFGVSLFDSGAYLVAGATPIIVSRMGVDGGVPMSSQHIVCNACTALWNVALLPASDLETCIVIGAGWSCGPGWLIHIAMVHLKSLLYSASE